MRIYIAGKITGDNHYKKKFCNAERKLKKLGHSVMNPARLGNYPDFTWESYMRVSRVMQEQCNAILLLPDWGDSKGAKEEYLYADKLHQRKFYSLRDIPDNN